MKEHQKNMPPRWATRLLRWYCAPHLVEEVEGDLNEEFEFQARHAGIRKARLDYIRNVLGFLKPFALRRKKTLKTRNAMIKNYFKVGMRNLLKNKGYSAINIGGLSVGMAVAILIGLWIWDELTFNKNFEHYSRIAKVWQFVQFGAEKSSYDVLPIPLGAELREAYPDFVSVSMSTSREALLSTHDKTLIHVGNYVEPSFLRMFTPELLSGSSEGLNELHAIMISASTAMKFFGTTQALNQSIKINNDQTLTVTGIFKDFPASSSFKEVSFLAPWNFFLTYNDNAKNDRYAWDNNSYNIYAELKDGADIEDVSQKIRDIRMKKENPPQYKPEFFLHPMNKWHLYADFKDGKNTGGLIEYVWLFGLTGVFVLILACINFMNLATARSEKRSKEVGIRKSIGSVRIQLVFQFLAESFLIVIIGFALALAMVQTALPLFNQVAEKSMTVPWENPIFWLLGLSFSLLTGLLAGTYPALYLSSFSPVRVLKGTFRLDPRAAIPRKLLVVLQFTVSITMIIGFSIIFKQIRFAKNLAAGYDRSGLIEVSMNTQQLSGHFDALRNDLLKTGAVEEVSQSSGSVTTQSGGTTNFGWTGKDPESKPLVMANWVTHEYGKTVGWQMANGRDFSREMSTDSASIVINESAVRLMGFETPLGEQVRYNGRPFQVIGVIKDMIKESPFAPVKPTFYVLDYKGVNVINIKLTSEMSASDALGKVGAVFNKHDPASPFDYSFVDETYARKFADVERIGKLSSFFAILATFISTLGIFGLASFTAEQRTKEIGIKKVLGASIFQLWQMLSRDFVVLVLVSIVLSTPIAYYFMSNWLVRFEYRTDMPWWVFAGAGGGSLVITLLTVSYQSVKAAMTNPAKSLRSE